MKLTYKTPDGRIAFELDVTTGKVAFEVIAAVQELFEEPDCGACGSKHIRHNVREFDGNRYYKLVCLDCSAQLDFGQFKDGKGLFSKRRDENKQVLENRGWYVWQGNGQ